ncbi:MAG: VWA domain-containing protein [Gemmataceae bacterium]|nr:VWA domain-containing protein [Gemmataceae bacterium]
MFAIVGLVLPLLGQPAPPYHIDFDPGRDVTLLDHDEHGNKGLFINVRFTITLEGGTKLEDLAGADYKLKIEEDGQFIPPELDVPRPAPVETFSAVLALDTSGSMKERNRMAQAKAAAEEFLRRLPARADCGLILFDHEIRQPVLPPSADRAGLSKEIRDVQPRGGTAYLDATAKGIEVLGKAPAGRDKAVVVLTDGVDLNSQTPLNLVIHEAIKHKVRVYTIGIGEPGRQERVTTALVLDHSGSMKPPADDHDILPKIQALHRAGKRFVEIMPSSGQVSIVPFSTDVGRPRDFSPDKSKLIEQIQKLQAFGETALFDATYVGICTLEAEGGAGKRAVVAMTDGVDNTSRRRVEEVIERAQEAKVPLYMLGFGREGELDQKTMEHMARSTGGRYYHAKNEKALLDIFENLSIELHDDGIDEIALKKLASETHGAYYPAKDVSQLKLILQQVSETITQKRYAVTFKSRRQVHDGTARNVALKLVRRGEVVSNAAGGPINVEEQVVQTATGGYQVHGVVPASMDHLVYLGFLIVIGLLIALPAMMRRVSGA